jgi:putative nucleotidyltransferase with HDIG domain
MEGAAPWGRTMGAIKTSPHASPPCLWQEGPSAGPVAPVAAPREATCEARSGGSFGYSYLPLVLLATALVAAAPVAAAWALHAVGVVGYWESCLLAAGLSVAASCAGAAVWCRCSTGDVLFSDLMLWGWLRRRRVQRQIRSATELLFLSDDRPAMSRERHEGLIRWLAAAIEAQDPYLNGHSRRVANHSARIARTLGLPSSDVAKIMAAAAMHDIGKFQVPSSVLNKPGPLADSELALIRRHAEEGAKVVSALGDPELTAIVRHHHERVDGNGYPAGLVGDQIPLGARIVAVADTFDAVTSARPYRPAARHKEAIGVLLDAGGTQLDPAAVRAFLRSYAGSRKPLLVWTLLTSSPQRAVALLSGEPLTAPGRLLAIAAATSAVGSAALLPITAGQNWSARDGHRALGRSPIDAIPGVPVSRRRRINHLEHAQTVTALPVASVGPDVALPGAHDRRRRVPGGLVGSIPSRPPKKPAGSSVISSTAPVGVGSPAQPTGTAGSSTSTTASISTSPGGSGKTLHGSGSSHRHSGRSHRGPGSAHQDPGSSQHDSGSSDTSGGVTTSTTPTASQPIDHASGASNSSKASSSEGQAHGQPNSSKASSSGRQAHGQPS